MKQLKDLKKMVGDLDLRELLSGSSVSFLIKIMGIAAGYFFTLLVTREFGAKVIGIYALSLTLITIFSTIGRLGVDTALLRFVAEYASRDRTDRIRDVYLKAAKALAPFNLALSLLLFIGSPFIAEKLFQSKNLSFSFQIASIAILPMTMIWVNAESLRGLKKITSYSFLTGFGLNLFASFVLLAALLFSKNKNIPLVSYVISTFFIAVISFWMWLKNAFSGKTARSNTASVREILSISLPMLVTSSMALILSWADIIMLGMFRTESEVGIYNIALKIAMLGSFALVAVNSIAAPKFAEYFSNNDLTGLGKIVRQSTKMIFWVSFPILLLIFIRPKLILGIFGNEFRVGAPALLFLATGQFINAISGSVGYLLNMTNHQKSLQYTALVSVSVNIVFNYLLIPRYGITGAAFSTALSGTAWNMLCVFLVRRHLKIWTVYIPLIGK